MKICHIKDDYINYLRQFDSTVYFNKTESRPYIGALIEISNYKYYAPFTSPKAKHMKMRNSMDFRKIDGGRMGAINFNNMIPVVDDAIIIVDVNGMEDSKYKRLLQKQLQEIKKDSVAIIDTATKLREMLLKPDEELTDLEKNVKARCCKLELLEEKAKAYAEQLEIINQVAEMQIAATVEENILEYDNL